jgi:ubiquitin-like 1-activating enzyme E1 B
LQANGHATNGKKAALEIEGIAERKKRSAEEALGGDSPESKRAKTVSNGTDRGGKAAADDLIVLDDSADGAIVIGED